MHPSLRRHYLPPSPTILGVTLQPFTIRHWLVLDVIESPFFVDGAAPDFADVQIAVHVCRHRPDQVITRFVPGKLRSWLQTFRFRALWADEREKLNEYFAEALKGPRYFQTDDAGFEVKTCVQEYLLAALKRHGVPRAQALAMSPAMARWQLAIHEESAGREQLIVTQKDVEIAHACGHLNYGLN